MITQFLFIQMLLGNSTMLLTDFSDKDLSNWYIVNDVVMGGRSDAIFYMNDDSAAVFKGSVSLENNGGFSMVKYNFENRDIKAYSKIVLKVKGDNKRYQLRLQSDANQMHSYIKYFQTTNDWQIIELDLENFYPSFRGRKLNLSNFEGNNLEGIAFLIGNKKAEDFELMIKWIALK